MVEVIVTLVVIVFIIAGFRDGLAKTLGSMAMLFLALFASSAALAALTNFSAEFGNPKSYLSIVTFFFLWLVFFTALDLLLKLILKVVVTITVLGPLDQVGGLLLGGVKGLLIAGIILQIILAFPLSAKNRTAILGAVPAKFSLAAFQFIYPAAKKFQPYFNDLIKTESKDNFMDNIVVKENVTQEVTPGLNKIREDTTKKILGSSPALEKRLNDLLKDENLKPTAPQGSPR